MSLVTVGTRVRLPGFHRWPEAHEERAYLRQKHRHLFGVEAVVRVGHDDRDVEFHDLQDMLRQWWGEGAPDLGRSSCEDLARSLDSFLAGVMGLAVESVTITEDDESWATYRPGVRA